MIELVSHDLFFFGFLNQHDRVRPMEVEHARDEVFDVPQPIDTADFNRVMENISSWL